MGFTHRLNFINLQDIVQGKPFQKEYQ